MPDTGAWRATVHWGAKSREQLKQLGMQAWKIDEAYDPQKS